MRLTLRMAGDWALMVRRGASACCMVPIWVARAAYCVWGGGRGEEGRVREGG